MVRREVIGYRGKSLARPLPAWLGTSSSIPIRPFSTVEDPYLNSTAKRTRASPGGKVNLDRKTEDQFISLSTRRKAVETSPWRKASEVPPDWRQ